MHLAEDVSMWPYENHKQVVGSTFALLSEFEVAIEKVVKTELVVIEAQRIEHPQSWRQVYTEYSR